MKEITAAEKKPTRKRWKLTEMEKLISLKEGIKIKRILICPPA